MKTVSRLTALAALLLATLTTAPQTADPPTTGSWEDLYEQLLSPADDEDGDEAALTDDIDLLQQLADHPIDLNRATRDDLEQLPFLSDQQIEQLVEYQQRYGPMRSMGELRMVPSMDHLQLTLLPYFTCLGTPDATTATSTTGTGGGRHELSAALRVPCYQRRGDRQGYLGYPYRHWTRYEYTARDNRLRLGLQGSQDAGEPLLSRHNRWGYDCYTYYAQLRNIGALQTLVVGKYRFTAGMGLVCGSSFSLGKQATLTNMARHTTALRPHTSRSEADYLQGAAATVRLRRALTLTAGLSNRPIDATLNDDGTARTLASSGYHRTPSEMARKHNTHLTEALAALTFRHEGLHAGLTAMATHPDRRLSPQRTTPYRRHYLHGSHLFAASADYGYTRRALSMAGETALDGHAHVAMLHSLSLRLTDDVSLTLLHRFYSYRYAALHAHSLADGSSVQNENGLYAGMAWTPARHLRLTVYADYARHPWARYLVSRPSHSYDLFAQADWRRGRWALQGRTRLRLRQRDNADATALTRNDEQRSRLTATYTAPARWTAKTQLDLVRATYLDTQHGWMLSQHATLRHGSLDLRLSAAFFDTDGYRSRLYLYEHHLAREFAIPSFYGEGLRLALTTRLDLGSLRLSAKVGYTSYFDRSSIGTGLQQTPHSSVADIDLQLRWRL